MGIVNDWVREDLLAALEPRPSDLEAARAVVSAQLADGSRTSTESLLLLACQRADVPITEGAEVDVYAAQRDRSVRIDPEHPALRRHRVIRGVHEVIADMVSAGQIVPMKGPDGSGNDIVIQVIDHAPGGGGIRGGESVPMPTPAVATHYRLSRRLIDDDLWRELHVSLTSVDLMPLLGARGNRCFTEALDAFRRGLYLAAANMAGAASEAAWYSVATHLQDSEPSIAKALAGEDTVRLIQRVAERLQSAPRQRSTVTELLAHAAFLRDLRNYGPHPRPQQQADREGAFTETGCLTVILQTQRYLARLLEVAIAVGLPLDEAPK
jgi:hypothetical protein